MSGNNTGNDKPGMGGRKSSFTKAKEKVTGARDSAVRGFGVAQEYVKKGASAAWQGFKDIYAYVNVKFADFKKQYDEAKDEKSKRAVEENAVSFAVDTLITESEGRGTKMTQGQVSETRDSLRSYAKRDSLRGIEYELARRIKSIKNDESVETKMDSPPPLPPNKPAFVPKKSAVSRSDIPPRPGTKDPLSENFTGVRPKLPEIPPMEELGGSSSSSQDMKRGSVRDMANKIDRQSSGKSREAQMPVPEQLGGSRSVSSSRSDMQRVSSRGLTDKPTAIVSSQHASDRTSTQPNESSALRTSSSSHAAKPAQVKVADVNVEEAGQAKYYGITVEQYKEAIKKAGIIRITVEQYLSRPNPYVKNGKVPDPTFKRSDAVEAKRASVDVNAVSSVKQSEEVDKVTLTSGKETITLTSEEAAKLKKWVNIRGGESFADKDQQFVYIKNERAKAGMADVGSAKLKHVSAPKVSAKPVGSKPANPMMDAILNKARSREERQTPKPKG